MVALYNALPEFVPAPVGYGAYASNPDIHFFLSEFLNMMGEIPEIRIFIETPAKLHTKGISSEGEYGFDVHTYKGPIPHPIYSSACMTNGKNLSTILSSGL